MEQTIPAAVPVVEHMIPAAIPEVLPDELPQAEEEQSIALAFHTSLAPKWTHVPVVLRTGLYFGGSAASHHCHNSLDMPIWPPSQPVRSVVVDSNQTVVGRNQPKTALAETVVETKSAGVALFQPESNYPLLDKLVVRPPTG